MLNKLRSKKILNLIFKNIKALNKLKTIIYNKKLQQRLNITKKDFQEYSLLQEFNKKYDLKIEEINIESIKIKNIDLNIGFIEDMNKIKFSNLKDLILIYYK